MSVLAEAHDESVALGGHVAHLPSQPRTGRGEVDRYAMYRYALYDIAQYGPRVSYGYGDIYTYGAS